MNSPINKHASQEVIALLQFLYANYGKVTLTGQHDQMYSMGKPHQPSALIEKMTGVRPLIWGGEWGFSDERHDPYCPKRSTLCVSDFHKLETTFFK